MSPPDGVGRRARRGHGLAGATVLGALTSLELRGLVVETFGRYRATGPLAAWGAVGRPGSPG